MKQLNINGKLVWHIRAAQGHTMRKVKDEALLTSITDGRDVIAVHGTYSNVWHLIVQNGLNRMSRNHIHFAPQWQGHRQIISGMRNTCDVFVQADVEKSLKDGVKWYQSSNKVYLTAGFNGALPLKYFKKAVVKGQTVVLDGQLIND